MTLQKTLYWNKKQEQFLQAQQKTKVFRGGRGSGKSTTLGISSALKCQAMPRGKIFLSSNTYNQILTKTLPAAENLWQQIGYVEHEHYVVGQKPLKHFDTPYSPPRKYQNVISFVNGFCIEMISMDRPDLGRGGSYDGGEIDEMQNLKGEAYRKILLPSVRGNKHRFTSYLHSQINLYGSTPWLSSGYWTYDFDELAKSYPDDYLVIEASVYDNIEILTQEGIDRMIREMTYLEVQIELLNRRIIKVERGFYAKFSEERHGYVPDYEYGDGERGIVVKGTKDVRRNELLEVSFDFSGWFNCMTIWQEQDGFERCLRQFHVKNDDRIRELVKNFCEYFKDHGFKFARVWGEPRGHDKNPLTNKTIYETIKDLFYEFKWDCEIAVQPGRATNHIERHHFLDEVLKEELLILPKFRINTEECKDVIVALNTTEINPDFTKNKSAEKDRNFPQEHAPHYTDTVDYYLTQKHGWKMMVIQSDRPSEAYFP